MKRILTIIAVFAVAAVIIVMPTKAEKLNLQVDLVELEKTLVDAGVIDPEKFLPQHRTELNLLWALGLSNKNAILEQGPMADPRYGDPGRFASTGGWTLARGNTMDHYSKHSFVMLTEKQQELVERVSKNIYRPCCNNSTYFPDCNHGMAMLGLLELMASQGASEEEMYKVALQVNSYWFPDTYITIATYMKSKGVDWNAADSKEVLGYNYSSAVGYRQILNQVIVPEKRSDNSCSV